MDSLNNDPRAIFVDNVADLNEKVALQLVKDRLTAGEDPILIAEDCRLGLRLVGERYARGEFFLAGLVMAGEIFRRMMELLQPVIEDRIKGNEKGVILIGTVQGDIHDLGKNTFSMLMASYGFTIHDLGVDVPPADFLYHATVVQPDIIGLSGLLTSAQDPMKETIKLLRSVGNSEISSLPVIIGGTQVDERVQDYVRADYCVNDATVGVRICQDLLSKKTQR